MPHRASTQRLPDLQPPRAPHDGEGEGEERWRRFAWALLALLSQTQRARSVDAERYTAEREQERAAHAQDLVQDRESFLDVVAHELKTPVAVIKAYAELLEAQADRSEAPAVIGRVVHHILEQAELMTEMIEEVLDVQRLRLGKLPLEVSRVDLAQLTHAVVEELQQTTRHHEMRLTLDEPLPPVLLGDRRRLRQVLANLVENALKYAEGGRIDVRITTTERHGQPHALVAVRDEGPGLDAADLNRIFGRFEQAHTRPVRGHVGLGLGLYIARQIARAHGGDVLAESPGKGQGSTFTLLLPVNFDPGG